jgi:hypothetical protein
MPIKFEATADFTDLVRENQKAQRENAKLADQLRALTGLAEPMGAAGTKAFKDLASAADQAIKSLQTPADQFAAQVEKLDAAMKAKKLGADEHARAIDQLAATYSEAAGPVEQLRIREQQLDSQLKAGRISQDEHAAAMDRARTAALQSGSAVDRLELQLADLARQHDRGELSAEDHAQAILELTQQFTAAASPTDRYERAVRELEQQHERGEISAAEYRQEVSRHKSELDGATQSGEKQAGMFGTLGGKLLALGSGYMSFQAILGQVKAALDYVNQETERAIGSADKMTDANKRLAQVATSAEDYDMMVRRADELAATFGEDRDVARRVSFSARSEGFEQALPEILKYGDVVSAESAAGVAGQVPGLFGGEIDAMAAVNATLVAAEQSRLSFEDIARALPKVAEGGALQGSSSGETMGVLSVMAGHFASGDTAADRFKALATRMSLDDQTKGRGIIGGVEALQAMPEEDRKKFLGDSQELNVAYTLLSNRMQDVKDRVAMVNAEIEAASSGGETALQRKYQQMYAPTTDTGQLNLALEQKRQAIIQEEIANEGQFAKAGAKREAAIATEKARQKDAGYTGFSQYGGDAASRLARTFGASDETAAAMTRAGAESVGAAGGSEFWLRRLAAGASFGGTDFVFGAAGYGAGQNAGSNDDLRAIRDAMERTAAAVEDTRDVARTPRPGASAAAAAPSTQRMGR